MTTFRVVVLWSFRSALEDAGIVMEDSGAGGYRDTNASPGNGDEVASSSVWPVPRDSTIAPACGAGFFVSTICQLDKDRHRALPYR